MQTNGQAIRNQMVPSPAHVWETLKGWSRKHITQEGMVDVALALVALDTVGFLVFSLNKAFATYTITGF